MSTKTLKKRVALATVVALGAGVLSLVSVSSANATAAAAGTNGTVGGTLTPPDAAVDILNIATVTNTTGATVDPTAAGGGAATASSVGLVNVSDIAGNAAPVAGTTQTATLLSNGTLVVYALTSSSHVGGITVTGGTISKTVGSEAINSSLTGTYSAASGILVAEIKPSTGATSMNVKLTVAASGTAANLRDGVTSGTLKGQINVTIASASTAGVASAAKSGVWYVDAYGSAATTSDSTTSGVGTAAYNQAQFGQVRARDAYGSAITLTGGLLQISATNGALVKIHATTPTDTGSNSADYSTSGVDGWNFSVVAPASAPVNTTVTVSYNGTVIGTKSYTFTGNVAKITLASAVNGKIGGATGNTVKYYLTDAAGNALYFTYGGVPSTATPLGNLQGTSALNNSIVSGLVTSGGSAVTADITSGTSTTGKVAFTCGIAGTTPISVTYTNNDGTVITSNSLSVLCAGDPKTYTATLDKSSYVPGAIAVLTITFKDSKGNLANDVAAVADSTHLISWNGSQMTTAAVGPSATGADTLTNGVLTLKYIVGTTTGAYTGLLDVPNLDSSSTPQVAVPVSYTVADSSTSLNDVLKGIVSLIASINKQIAALAKLVTKK